MVDTYVRILYVAPNNVEETHISIIVQVDESMKISADGGARRAFVTKFGVFLTNWEWLFKLKLLDSLKYYLLDRHW